MTVRPAPSPASPAGNERTVAGEDLDAVVAGVGDIQVAVRAQGQRPGPAELPRLGARAAPALHELAVRVELADALVLPELGDVVVAVCILDGSR